MKKVLSRLAKVGRSSSHAAAEPAERDPQADTPGGTPEEQTERPAAYDLVGRERTLSGLQRAVWDGDVARVRSLTAKSTAGVQARDREGRSLLHLAAARGHREMVELLLERRLPVDAEDGDGNTPLLKAAEADSAASVRLLLERGASASHCNHHQQNGLHVSSRRGAEPVLQALLQHGANVDQVDKDGHTPLHLSVLHAHPELAAALLLHGAALAPADRDGRTALHLAAGRGLSELVAQLLEGGAEAELRDDEGLTAGELAVREGFPHIQSQIRRLSRRHRSLSQMFSVEDLGVDGPPPAETAKVQRLGSTSSAGVPTPRVASSLSSAGVPTPRLASSLSSAREAAPRLASSLSSAGEPEPGPGRPDSAATPAAPISVGSDSWSDDDELNFAPPPRKCSTSLAGTLGRDGTLQGTDELWEGNATLRADGTIGGGSSPRDGGPTDPSPPPVEPPPLQLASPDRPPRLGQRRVSVSLPLSADRALPVTGERRRRGSVTSVSSTSSVSSLKSVGRTLREWRQTLLAPLRSRRRRRSLELPVRRHSIAIDSFLTEQAELTADDQVEDMYREEEAPRRAVSHSPEPAPARPPRGRLRSRSVEAPPPAAAPRRHRRSGGSLADIVEADAEEEAEERRRRRGRWRSAGGGGRPGRRLSLDVTALGLPRSRHRSLVSPTADQRGSDG
ncbi:Ankyrin repeat domain-containing protein 7 [Amphibalanus amphitrite]|uniref:Ankyrin repeat domain-containing protein 7 n=1 Tax=Amphibalanus amphitrite TaxID=1232801 RepID=A0A6A4VUZ2_AMPAM|nr:Ankyrin repeat domain-containing protein 7 [Amphibalanus amphitrite]